MNRLSPVVAAVVAVGLLLSAWEIAVMDNAFLAFLVGKPSEIGQILIDDTFNAGLLSHVGYTLTAAIIGLLIGTSAGLSIGLAVGYNRSAELAFSPMMNALSVIPLFAIGPMTVFWFGQDQASKIFLSALATALLASTLTYQHMRSTPQAMRELVSAMAGRRSKIFWVVEAPFATLSLLTNTRALLGAAVSGAIIGEFIGANRGVGHYIVVAEGLYDVNRIWAGVLALSFGAIFLGWLGVQLETFARSRL
jgi:NitT/TauT family transport system permease protein